MEKIAGLWTENLHTSSDNISELTETNLDPFAVELWESWCVIEIGKKKTLSLTVSSRNTLGTLEPSMYYLLLMTHLEKSLLQNLGVVQWLREGSLMKIRETETEIEFQYYSLSLSLWQFALQKRHNYNKPIWKKRTLKIKKKSLYNLNTIEFKLFWWQSFFCQIECSF